MGVGITASACNV